jgi:hypothetical protein
MTSTQPCLLLALAADAVPDDAVSRAAGEGAIDLYRLRLLLRSRSLVVLARGDSERLAAAANALSSAGVRCAVVSAGDARSIPRPHVAGGVAKEADGVLLRVHGKPFGPPIGAPLLFVFGDVGRQKSASGSHAGDTLAGRLQRAAHPVVDVIWREGRVRIPLRGMSWRELPDATFSAPGNLAHLLEQLTERSGGAVLDLGFDGQDVFVEPAAVADEPLEGADRNQLALFERYSAAAAIAWSQNLYPPTTIGKMALAVPSPGASDRPGSTAISPAIYGVSPIPWIRKDRASRLRLGLVPWIVLGPLFAIRMLPNARVAAAALAVCGVASLAVGLAGLRLRERVRAVPQARVRSLAMGSVELSGRVVPCVRLIAPFSRVACAWYRYEFQQLVARDESGEGYRTLYGGSSGDLPFRLDDGTGSVLIQPAGAQVDVEPETTPAGPAERAREWILAEGETIFVVGVAQRRSPFEEERRLLSERIRAVKHDPAALARYGLAPDGEGAVEAWERARGDIERQVTAELSARASEADDVFVGSAPDAPFLISAGSRSRQTARLSWQFAAGAALGVVYLAAALALLVLS